MRQRFLSEWRWRIGIVLIAIAIWHFSTVAVLAFVGAILCFEEVFRK